MRLAHRLARTLMVLMIVTLMAGAAPAAAWAGFCASAPCCAAGQRELVTLDDAGSGCCGPAACLEEGDATAATKGTPSIVPSLDGVAINVVRSLTTVVSSTASSSQLPPRALAQRLSILATLLI